MNRTAKALAIVLALVVVGGAIYLAYQSGFDAGALTAATAVEGDRPSVALSHGWYRGGWGLFPFGFLFPLLILLLIFGALRGRYGPPRHPGWDPTNHLADHVERRFEEWHKRAHESGGQQ